MSKLIYSHVSEWICRRHNWAVIFEVKVSQTGLPMTDSNCPVCQKAGRRWRKYTRQ